LTEVGRQTGVTPNKEKLMNAQMETDTNGNKIVNEIELGVEELEERIAPGLNQNNNEILVTDTKEIETTIEELEPIVAPGYTQNNNETLVSDTEEIETAIEELEQIVAPSINGNHNESLVRD
jgi:hypothetical protein